MTIARRPCRTKHHVCVLALGLALLPAHLLAQTGSDAAAPKPSGGGEMRGMWVVRTSLVSRRSVHQIVVRAAKYHLDKSGLTPAIHQPTRAASGNQKASESKTAKCANWSIRNGASESENQCVLIASMTR